MEREKATLEVQLEANDNIIPTDFESSFQTALISLPFGLLGWFTDPKFLVEGTGFEPVYAMRADLQSAAFNHSATPPFYYKT